MEINGDLPSPAIRAYGWHVADIVYDTDTLAVFLDRHFVSLHGFGPENSIDMRPTGSFTIVGVAAAVAFRG